MYFIRVVGRVSNVKWELSYRTRIGLYLEDHGGMSSPGYMLLGVF